MSAIHWVQLVAALLFALGLLFIYGACRAASRGDAGGQE